MGESRGRMADQDPAGLNPVSQEGAEGDAPLRAALEQSSDATLVVDLRGRVLWANRNALTLLECALEQLLGQSPGFSLVGEGPTEIEIAHRGGSPRTGELRTTRIVWEDQDASLVSILDVTHLKQLERQLAQGTRELAQVRAELDHFAHSASHDIRAPLSVIYLSLKLLEQEYFDRLDAQGQKFVGRALEGVQRMTTLLDGLLEYARVTTQPKPLALTNLDAVLERVCSDLSSSIQEGEAHITHGPLPTVLVDEEQLTCVFQHLLSNALKFRSQHSPVIHVGARHEACEWELSVRDNGIGIAPADARRLFTPFVRGNTHQPGVGLGLATCKKIIERHGGRMWLESIPEQGATFYFTLPDQPVEGT
jgi:light-regulated signal transduction histidine kinase (bacteriophytochrome)